MNEEINAQNRNVQVPQQISRKSREMSDRWVGGKNGYILMMNYV